MPDRYPIRRQITHPEHPLWTGHPTEIPGGYTVDGVDCANLATARREQTRLLANDRQTVATLQDILQRLRADEDAAKQDRATG